MERERFYSSNPNSRNLGFISDNRNNNLEKPLPSPLLDQFNDLMRQREEELRYSSYGDEDDDGDVNGIGINDVVRIYDVVLGELVVNSKPIITELTMIAGEQREFAEGIADVICARIIEVPVEHKLPSLYLLDSIVKNIGGEYVRYFSSRLPEVFVEAYRQVDPNQHSAMRHLFGTWTAVFPSSVLRKIAVELQFSPLGNHQPPGSVSTRSSESPSPRPAHGIHVNPKYLEARRQYENASALNEVHDARGVSPSFQRYEQKPAVGIGEYDVDNVESISQQVDLRRVGGIAPRGSISGEKRHLSPNYRPLRPSSPPRVRFTDSVPAPDDGYTIDKSPTKAVERASPAHGGLDYPPSRLSKRDGWMNHTNNNIQTRLGTEHKSEFDRQRPRALIDAYGNYRGESNLPEKRLTIERLDVNRINGETTTKKWQNTEEEEYVWEDMSPTPADRSRTNDLLSSHPSSHNTSTRPGLGRPAYMEPDYRAGYWPGKSQLPKEDDNSIFSDDWVSNVRPNFGDRGTNSTAGVGNQNNRIQIQGSKYSRDPWNLHSQSSEPYHEVGGKINQISLPSIGTVQQTRQRVPSLMDNTDDISSTVLAEKNYGQRPHSPPMPSQRWSQANGIPLPIHPQQNHQTKSQSNLSDANRPLTNQGASESSFLPHQQLDPFERKPGTSNIPVPLPNQLPGLTYLNNQSQVPVLLQPHVPKSMNYVTQNSPLLPYNRGPGVLTSMPLNRVPGVHPSLPGYGPNISFQVPGGMRPPLPPGPPPLPSSQNMAPVTSQPPSSGFTDLISSLMAQGVIKLTGSPSPQDSVGVEFNPDVLKVRHESSIKALYADLPRQCKTCGLRFKTQEEHSTHMDWHVTRNRISRKSKQKPSRKWFVSTSLWLSGAEAVGNDSGPGFLLPSESAIEKKDDEVMAVPADEDQSACALCGETFDAFYSDDTEEWMYKGAIYLNAPDGSTTGMMVDRSQLGPIVHAKCRSESTVDDGGNKIKEDGNQPKRIRLSL
ncbi:hypothetical protein ACHQM5_019554 [Ranunculus cassubicifolius]